MDGYFYYVYMHSDCTIVLFSIYRRTSVPTNQGVCQEGEYNTRVLKNECMWESLREVLQTVLLVKRTWSKSCMLLYVH